jgi:hypothetical protein
LRQTSSVVTTTPGGSGGAQNQRLASTFNVVGQGRDVLFVLELTNAAERRLEVNFPNGKTHEFVVVDSAGQEVWRSTDGRIFTQTIRNKLLGRGQSMRISHRWRAPTPGHYTVVASLNSSNFPLQQRHAFDAH